MKGSDKTQAAGTSLIVQWLRLGTPKAGTPGLVPGQGTRFHMLQLGVCMPQLKKKSHKKPQTQADASFIYHIGTPTCPGPYQSSELVFPTSQLIPSDHNPVEIEPDRQQRRGAE